MLMNDNMIMGGSELATEMISEQNNDYAIKELKKLNSELVSMYKKLGFVGYKFFKNRDVKKLLMRIDSLVSERFGFTVKHVYGIGMGYAVFTAPPKQYNIINRDVIKSYEGTKDYVNLVGKENIKSKDQIDNLKRDEDDLLARWIDSVETLDKTFSSDGVTIDLNKAYIKNLPKDYNIFLAVDYDMLINKADMTGDEITATLMHEVGHAFTHIEYSYRTVNNTAVLVDSIKDVIAGNSSFKKALKLSYSKLGGDVKDMEKSNVVTVTLMTVDKYMKSTLNMNNNNNHSATDSEQLADQFAGKFGLGGELSSALVKLRATGGVLGNAEFMQLMGAIYMQLAIASLLATASIMSAIALPLLVFLMLGMFGMVMDTIMDVYNGGGVRTGTTYDNDKQRHIRIRNEMVRQLRTVDLPKSVIKDILATISVLDVNIANSSTDDGVFSKLGRVLFSKNRASDKAKKLEEMVEELMENNLHVASNKLINL